MKELKKINLRGLSEVLSEKELKNVMGGSDSYCDASPCNCFCTSDSNCWGDCKKCVDIPNWVGKKVCAQN